MMGIEPCPRARAQALELYQKLRANSIGAPKDFKEFA
jgi:hypothetical protein